MEYKVVNGVKRYRVDGHKLLVCRNEKGLLQKDIDRQLGVKGRICPLELGTIKTATEDFLRQIASILEINWEDFVLKKRERRPFKTAEITVDGKKYQFTGRDIHVVIKEK